MSSRKFLKKIKNSLLLELAHQEWVHASNQDNLQILKDSNIRLVTQIDEFLKDTPQERILTEFKNNYNSYVIDKYAKGQMNIRKKLARMVRSGLVEYIGEINNVLVYTLKEDL